MKTYKVPVIIEKDKEGFYIAEVPRFKGCHTYGKSLSELHKNLEDIIGLFLQKEYDNKSFKEEQNEFVGIQFFEINTEKYAEVA